MKPKLMETPRHARPVASLQLRFRQRGKGYLQFGAALILTGGTITFLIVNESASAVWLSKETVLLAVLFSLPGLLFLMVGMHYFTRKSEIVLFRDRVEMTTKTLFMLKANIRSYPMSEFTGVVAARETGKNVTLNYVMLSHPDLSKSVVVGREFPSLEAAKKRRDELARLLQFPALEPEREEPA